MSLSVPAISRLIAFAVAFALMATALAACGDDSSDGGPSSEQAAKTSTSDDPTGADRADDKDGRDGGSDSTSGGANGGAVAEGRDDEPAAEPTSEEERIAATVEGMYRDLASSDARGVCSAMTNAAREQIAAQVPGGSGASEETRTCEASLSKFMEAAAQSGVLQRTLRARVTDVSVDGGTATVTVSFGSRSGKVQLRREEGDWRFGPGAVGPGA